jgi:hypothetical protein
LPVWGFSTNFGAAGLKRLMSPRTRLYSWIPAFAGMTT